jgi:hypothetical protein
MDYVNRCFESRIREGWESLAWVMGLRRDWGVNVFLRRRW